MCRRSLFQFQQLSLKTMRTIASLFRALFFTGKHFLWCSFFPFNRCNWTHDNAEQQQVEQWNHHNHCSDKLIYCNCYGTAASFHCNGNTAQICRWWSTQVTHGISRGHAPLRQPNWLRICFSGRWDSQVQNYNGRVHGTLYHLPTTSTFDHISKL